MSSGSLRLARCLIVYGDMQIATSDASTLNHAQAAAEMAEDPRVARILAKSLFRDMKASGIPQERILEVASELIGLVTSDLNAANGRA